jgi:ADP-ribosylglycohydrolase
MIMMTRLELARNRDLCMARALGSLLGLAVGDALGDLGRNDEYRQRYGLITNLYVAAGSTDDTEFALLAARMLLDNGGDLTSEAVVRAWQRYVLDQGGVFERGGKSQIGAVANLRRGLTPPLSGRDNVNHDDDGAAMRIAPIGIICAGEPDRAAAMAETEAQISHYCDGIWAAQAVAASVAVAMVGGSAAEIVQAGIRQIPADSWLGRGMARAMAICDEAHTIEAAWGRLHSDLWTPTHSASAEAIPQTYAIFRLTAGDFRRSLFWGANFGRDADTICAILGAFCGACHGIAVIPNAWVEQVRRPRGVCLKFAAQEDLVEVAQALAGLID